MTFKAGDLVKLKSGSPLLIVENPISKKGDGDIACRWFNSREHRFETVNLFAETLAENKPPPNES